MEYPGNEADFRHLDVVAPGGATLFADDLSGPGVLADFTGPLIATPDRLPVVMDGAKRDRVVWSGDLGVEGPTDFYSTGATDFIRDSLQLLGSYQDASGESGADVAPTMPLGTFPERGYTYSATYSMDEVTNIATYYLYTGDLAFVRSEWPMISRELAYDRSLIDSRGLVATDSSDGSDWDHYDGPKSGEVTATNDIYDQTLVDAATMAGALGLHTLATTYRQQAAALRSDINRYLFDPSTGLYVLSDAKPSAVAQDGNSLAVLSGIAPAGQDQRILSALATALPSTSYGPFPFSADAGYRRDLSPFVTNEEVQALLADNDTDAALSLVEAMWGHMDAPGPDDTGADWELLDADGTPGSGFTSLAHGWSSGPTADLSAYVLGVRPTGAGFRTWLVQPHPGPLAWAEGDVPTPRGTIAVRWGRAHTPGSFSVEVGTPASTSGTISVPVPTTGATVTLRSSANGSRAVRSYTSAPGSSFLPMAVPGGPTYVVDVVPRRA